MRIRAEEVVHKMTYRRIITILPVYIDYAGFVPIINVSHVFYTSGYFVQFLSASEIIPLGNKYDISSGEVFEIIAGIGRINVQQAAVVSSSFRNRTAVTALNLDIVFHSIGINSVDIQSSGTSLQILYFKLRLRVLDCKEESCQAVIANAPSVLDCLDEECTAHFQKVQDILTEMGIEFVIDSKIVRGLDYYTRTVFEFVSDGLTVCGGGRYDNLVEECGGKPTGAVGFGLGIERLMMILEKQNGPIEEVPERDVYIGSMGEKGLIKAQGITLALRKAGVRAECDTVERSVKAQMKYANKIGAKYSVIIGDSELENNSVELKEMETGEKETVVLSELAEVLKAKLK